jgi:hypothetical protein
MPNTTSAQGLAVAYLRGIAAGIGEGLVSPRSVAAALGVTVSELAELFARHNLGEALAGMQAGESGREAEGGSGVR